MSFVVTLIGIISKIEEATIKGSFENRRFVVSEEKDRYNSVWIIEAQQGRGLVLDSYQVGERVIVNCEVIGREWTKEQTGDVQYFTTLKMLTLQRLEDFQKPNISGAKKSSTSAADNMPDAQRQWDAKYGPNGQAEGPKGNIADPNHAQSKTTAQVDDLPF